MGLNSGFGNWPPGLGLAAGRDRSRRALAGAATSQYDRRLAGGDNGEIHVCPLQRVEGYCHRAARPAALAGAAAVIKNAFIILFGVVCAGLVAQAPEFMQPYTQRLGGWLDSYTRLVADLDARASQYNMTRDAYIAALRTSPDPKVVSEADNIARYPVFQKKLEEAHTAIAGAPPWKKGLVFAQHYQTPLLEAVYGDYKPAMPTTLEGAAYGGAGFGAGAIVLNILLLILRQLRRLLVAPMDMIKRRREPKKIKI